MVHTIESITKQLQRGRGKNSKVVCIEGKYAITSHPSGYFVYSIETDWHLDPSCLREVGVSEKLIFLYQVLKSSL